MKRLIALIFASLTLSSVFGAAPGYPSLTMSFGIDGDKGVVTGVVTAPTNDNNWATLPATTKMNIRVVRSCYALSETNIPIVTIQNLSPGESYTFTDDATPAWQYGYQYTYNAYASIGNEEGYAGYGSMNPGIPFAFGNNAVSATSVAKDDSFIVEISVTVPSMTSTFPAEELPMDMTALEFYRIPAGSNATPEFLGSIPSPDKGESYKFQDNTPIQNSENTYLVKCVSAYGFTQLQVKTFVGYDVPQAPFPVTGSEVENGGYRIEWTAPTEGLNYGLIDPEETFYNVYRCWGRGANDREQIASGLKDTEYVDYGTDMTFPRAVNYSVEACNNFGIGGQTPSSYTYNVLIGPAEKLPFAETFDGGTDHLWTFTNSTYQAQLSVSTEAEYGYETVEPADGSGLVYVNYYYTYLAGSRNEMTSYKISLDKAVNPYLSFYLYQIQGADITAKAEMAIDNSEFSVLKDMNVGDGTETGWQRYFIPIPADAVGKDVKLRFSSTAVQAGGALILDDIYLLDYLPAENLTVEYNREDCQATISWNNPSTEYNKVTSWEGIVDGTNIGKIESPWVFTAADYATPYKLSVIAVYDEIKAPESQSITISVPHPPVTEFTIDNHIFSIVTDSDIDVHNVIIKQYLGNAPLYKAPELVTFDDITYTVTGIGEGAYRDNTTLASVDLSTYIETIESEAFANCTSLMSITFNENILSIGERAFAGCSALNSVTFVSATPPEVADDAFSGIAEGCRGKCPQDSETSYGNIKGLSPIHFESADIESVNGEDASQIEYYNLNGVKIEKPIPGTPVIVRIRHYDGTTDTSLRM